MTVLNSNFLNKPVLVIGGGSIGERHIRNLWTLGYHNLYVYRQRNLPFKDIGDAKIKVLLDWKDVIAIKPFVAVITTPTSLHLQQAIESAKIGCHLLIEKPLSHNTEGIEELIKLVFEKGIYVRVGYMMRHHPLIKKIKAIIEQKQFGNLLSVTDKWGDYLPNWHPWEDYRESYAAKNELGGGVALTLSHDLDLITWLAASPVKTYHILKNYICNLEMNVEGGCDMLIGYENGVTGNIHLNYYEQTPERYLKLVFDKASISFEYFQNRLIIKHPNGLVEETTLPSFDRNDLFMAQAEFFFTKIYDYTTEESISQIEESIKIITICNHE
jgi:predicted dehydrogenase